MEDFGILQNGIRKSCRLMGDFRIIQGKKKLFGDIHAGLPEKLCMNRFKTGIKMKAIMHQKRLRARSLRIVP